MKINQFTGETDLRLFAEETGDSRPLTMSDVRTAAAGIPSMVQDAIRRERAVRRFEATMHEHDGNRLALKF